MLRKHLYLRLAAKAIQYRVPLVVRQVYLDHDGYYNSLCPRCCRTVPWEYMAFCSGCGQCLSWIFLDEAEELSLPIDPQRSPSKFRLSFLFRAAIQRLKSRHRTSLGADRNPSSAQYDSDDVNTAHEEAEEDEWIRVHIAELGGSWCGAKRQQCGVSGSLKSVSI